MCALDDFGGMSLSSSVIDGGQTLPSKASFAASMLQKLAFFLMYVIPHVPPVGGSGFMLLYRPRDVTVPCALSQNLRYDLSFGMGMSDTITLVFRTMFEVDYECIVELVAETEEAFLLIVVRYPNLMGLNCDANANAITVLKKTRCLRLCDFVLDPYSVHVIFPVKGRLRFRFLSNSSVNTDMDAHLYQVTATAARRRPDVGCFKRNETICSVDGHHYCFTSGVVCDGIKNCGVDDWFDERRSLCGLPVQRLGLAPAAAAAAAVVCACLAAGRAVLRCLPPEANSFFIFNVNEDNRLRIDPVLQLRAGHSPEPERARQISLIPVSSSSESEIESINTLDTLKKSSQPSRIITESKDEATPRRKMTMRSMTAKIQETLRFVTGGKNVTTSIALEASDNRTQNI